MTVNCAFEKELDRTVSEFKRLAFDHKGWTLKKDVLDIKIFSTEVPSVKYACFKGEAVVRMPVEKLMDFVHPTWHYRQIFDPNFDRSEILEVLDEDTGSAIIRQFFKPALLGILSPRDSIDVFQFFKTDSYQYSCLSSVEYPASPPDPNYVRSYAFPMGIAAVQTSDPDVSRVIAISHMDLQLPPLIPQSLVESIIPTNFVAYFQALKKMESESNYQRLGNDKPLCKWRT